MYTKIFNLPITINTRDIIVDVETTGTSFHNDEMTTVGWIKGNEMVISVREGKEQFDLEGLKEEWKDHRLWAWNCSFETGFLKMAFSEIKNKWSPYKPMREIISIDSSLSGDNHLAKEVPGLWFDFIETKDKSKVEGIVNHNRSCLLKELLCWLYMRV